MKSRAIGIMSGTSLDAIDISLITTDGEDFIKHEHSSYFRFTTSLKERLASLVNSIANEEKVSYLEVIKLENELSEQYADCVRHFASKFSLSMDSVDVIGCHGQTITHKPEIGISEQLINGSLLSWNCKKTLVCDFRRTSVAAGGEGAPLAPIYHKAITTNLKRPVSVVNIGGISNITWIGNTGEMTFFDCGVGNTLIDEWVNRKTNGRFSFDKDGNYAKQGKIIDYALKALLESSYVKHPPPKSLDKKYLSTIAERILDGLSLYDGCSTLTAFTAEGIKAACKFLPSPTASWVLVGGGSRNLQIVNYLHHCLEGSFIETNKDPLLHPDSVEACAFAYLAVRCLKRLPITYDYKSYYPLPNTANIHGGAIYYYP